MNNKTNKQRLHKIYYRMLGNCYNKSNYDYHKYGARGITVCKEWINSFEAFYAWAIMNGYEYKPNKNGRNTISIDRIDNNKGYFPDNCRWTTAQIQGTNQRKRRTNTSGYTGIKPRKYHTGIIKYTARIVVDNKEKSIGTFNTVKEAVEARNSYIIKNKLPHKVQDYIEDKELYSKIAETVKAEKYKNTYKRVKEDKRLKKIIAYTKDGEFVGKYNSVTEAGKALGIKSKSHISAVCTGGRKSTHGYIFRYL